MNNSIELSNISQSDLATKAAREFLIPFMVALDEKYMVNWHHEIIAQELEWLVKEVEAGRTARLILELPPRHSKSETSTKKFPAWVLGKHPDWPVIVASYSADLAKDFGEATRDMMKEKNYQAIFNTRLKDDKKAKDRWATQDGGNYTAAGVGGAITGKGFKIGIVDDPFKNRKDADSLLMRDNVWKWWTSTFYTRQNEQANGVIVINTRWHYDDLTGRLVEQMEENKKNGLPYDNWRRVSFPAIAIEDEEHRKAGEALWPERFNLEWLEKMKQSIGPQDWASLYQQSPIVTENPEFKKEYFKYYEQDDLKDKELRHTTTVDPAISEKSSADNSCVNTCGKESDKAKIYVREESAGRMDPLKLIDCIFYHQKKYRSDVYIETVAYQKALKYFIEEEMRKRQQYFNVYELKHTNKKEERIRGLIPLYNAGVIYHLKSMVDLETEALSFPKGRRDDRIDAMASQLEAIYNTFDKPKKVRPRVQTEESRYEGTLDSTSKKDDMEKWEEENIAKWG